VRGTLFFNFLKKSIKAMPYNITVRGGFGFNKLGVGSVE
jgi:hypothetical protein